MAPGIRAELAVADPGPCQVASASAGGEVHSVSRSAATDGDRLVEEFAAAGGVDAAAVDADPVFDGGTRTVYRYERDAEQACACRLVEEHGCVVREMRARDGTLVVSFYVEDVDVLRAVVADLRERHDGVSLRRLTRGAVGGGDGDGGLLVFDSAGLTDRQREVLSVAHDAGYFEYPRRSNATEVADRLGVAVATFREHLTVAQSKLLAHLLPE
ncbi:MAG: helix-turn-helix domain-containing protein [Halobacteriaceae archaeon]